MNTGSTDKSHGTASFKELDLPAFLLSRLTEIGYERPSPIQAETIPALLQGRDLVGQAQTGTGKTAAFALPALTRLDLSLKAPQVLVLTPTRELSIQVAEAFQTYAANMSRFSVLPVYGGQDYRIQVSALKRGVPVIVGTPGRLMDHMRRGMLSLDSLKTLVLDEADEMLRMGFIDDVQWILEQTPKERQIALFSATMPGPIKRIAKKHLNNPITVELSSKTHTADTIVQRYWPVQGVHKVDALTRILEAETTDAVIVFVRTKNATAELADKLAARGQRASALNGDMPQQQRETTVERLRNGRLDILVATDVAARGLDVERISHVINFDIPYDTESYVHRIGRTGRAGREGNAILFVAPRERRMLAIIEKAIGTRIEKMKLPTREDINERRVERLCSEIATTLEEADLQVQKTIVERYLGEHEVRGADVAAALIHMLQSQSSNDFVQDSQPSEHRKEKSGFSGKERKQGPGRKDRDSTSGRKEKRKHPMEREPGSPASMPKLEEGMERFRLEVGLSHGVAVSNVVGAVANEAGIESQYMGRISVNDDFTLIDLPEGMPKSIFKDLRKARVCGQAMRISRVKDGIGNGTPDTETRKKNERKQRKLEKRKLAAGNREGSPKSEHTGEKKSTRKSKPKPNNRKKDTKNTSNKPAKAKTRKAPSKPKRTSGKSGKHRKGVARTE